MKNSNIIRIIFYLVKRLRNAAVSFYKEIAKPTSFLKGEDFENFLRKKIFPRKDYHLLMKTHNFHENKKDFIESTLYPDFLFNEIKTDKEFFVEAKYREKLNFEDKLEWCKPYQFKRYKKYNDDIPVFIAIGFGGRPANPHRVFIVPLEEIKYNDLFLSFLDKYERKNDKNVLAGVLDRVYDYK